MKRHKKPFWKNIKFKYKLTITNENTLEEVVSFYVSKLNGLSVLLSISFILFIIAASIIVFTPLKNYLPGYMNSDMRREVVLNALRADSLAKALEQQHAYLNNLQSVLNGKIKADTVTSIDSLISIQAIGDAERTTEEETFRKAYEEAERFNLTAKRRTRQTTGLLFRSPLRGQITAHFDEQRHQYGVNIIPTSSNISAVLEGTVILATYTAARGYTLYIQHTQGFLSVYTHCASLLKQTSELVRAGEAVATISKTTDTPFFHFELWHNGVPLNPEKYIVF